MQPSGFEIPDQVREMADRSVDQARKALEQFLDATQRAVANAEGSAKSLSESAADVNKQALAYIEENIAETFDLAHRLIQARTMEEMTALQQEYIRRQMSTVADRGKQLGDMIGRGTAKATKASMKPGS
jgi:phasin